jgi:hypothetical protein
VAVCVMLFCDEVIPVVLPQFPQGARCLSILFEYYMGFHCCRAILSCSLVPIYSCIEARVAWRVLSTSVEAFLMLVAMSLSWWRGGRQSYSSPGMWLASL